MEKRRIKRESNQETVSEGERSLAATQLNLGNTRFERPPPATANCGPCGSTSGCGHKENRHLSFEDWQQVLRLRAAQKKAAKLEILQKEIETDACFEHTDKRRRVSPDLSEDKNQTKSVPSAISSDSRSYRYQQESRGSSNEYSNASVEPTWSDAENGDEEDELKVRYATDTESLSTVLSQQMDCVSLSNDRD